MGNYDTYYNKLAPIYDSVRLDQKPNFDNTLSVVLSVCKDKPSSILDIGCGSGRYGQALMASGHNVIGIDRSAAQIENAKKIINAQHCDAVKLAFDDNEFDICTMIMMIHQLDDNERLKAFAEAYRVLNENGILIIKTCSHKDLESREVYNFFPEAREVDFSRYPDIDCLCKQLNMFRNLNIRHSHFEIEQPVDEVINGYASRRTSNLALIDDETFSKELAILREAYSKVTSVIKIVENTFVIAYK